MELEIRIEGDLARLSLPQAMVIDEVADMKARLQEVIDARPARVVVDLDAVISADTASLQLLTAFVAAVSAGGGSFEWDNLSVPLYMAACQLNLEEHLKF